MRQRRVAGSLIVVVIVAGASIAIAKGGPGPGATAPTSGVGTSPSLADWYAFDLISRLKCVPPTAEECLDPAYADTPCGGRQRTSLRVFGTSTCSALCPTPTLTQCRDRDFLHSVCGQIEQEKESRAAPPTCHDEDPATICPASGSSCERALRTDLEQRQQADGSVLPADAPTRAVIIPASVNVSTDNPVLDRLSLDENGYANPTNTVLSRIVPARYDRFVAGTSQRYAGLVNRERTAFLDEGNAQLADTRVFYLLRRQAYENNGNDVASCNEYVYEKYYDYSVFEDAIKSGASARSVWSVAYADAATDAAIGTHGVAAEAAGQPLVLRQRDDTPLPVELTFPSGLRPKNEFMAAKVLTPAQRAYHEQYWDEGTGTYTVTIKLVSDVPVTLPRPVAITPGSFGAGEIFLLDQSLADAIRATPQIDEGWTYHHEMGTLLGPELDEEMEALDKYRQAFPLLLARRQEIVAEINRILKDALPDVPTLAVNGVPFDPSIFEDTWAPPETGTSQALDRIKDARDVEAAAFAQGFGITIAPLADATLLQGAPLSASLLAASQGAPGPMTTMSGSLGSSIQGLSQSALKAVDVGALAPLVTNPVFTSKGAKVAHLLHRLADVEGEIEAALVAARDKGCLEPDTFTTCDWSPLRFFQRVKDQFVAERERDHQRCLKWTQDEFAARSLGVTLPGRFAVPVPGFEDVVVKAPKWSADAVVCDDGAYDESPTELERYFGCFETWMGEVLAALDSALVGAKSIVDPTSGVIVPAETDSDGDRRGDDLFGVGYDYGVYWDVQGLDGVAQPGGSDDWCALHPSLHGHFSIDGRFLGMKFELVDAAADVSTDPGSTEPNAAYLEIAGFEIISVEEDASGFDPAKYNVVFDETYGAFEEYFHFEQTFTIGPVWVSVGGGMGGVFGAAARGAAGTLPDKTGGCAQGVLGIEGTFSPVFAVEGFAFAGLDYLIVAAGVKISLTIVSLLFPFTTQLRFEGKSLGGSPPRYDTRMRLTNNLDVVLQILDGRISVYVEICFILCESFEAEIFAWKGPRWDWNIFHSTLDIPLGKLVDIQQALTQNIGGQP